MKLLILQESCFSVQLDSLYQKISHDLSPGPLLLIVPECKLHKERALLVTSKVVSFPELLTVSGPCHLFNKYSYVAMTNITVVMTKKHAKRFGLIL